MLAEWEVAKWNHTNYKGSLCPVSLVPIESTTASNTASGQWCLWMS